MTFTPALADDNENRLSRFITLLSNFFTSGPDSTFKLVPNATTLLKEPTFLAPALALELSDNIYIVQYFVSGWVGESDNPNQSDPIVERVPWKSMVGVW